MSAVTIQTLYNQENFAITYDEERTVWVVSECIGSPEERNKVVQQIKAGEMESTKVAALVDQVIRNLEEQESLYQGIRPATPEYNETIKRRVGKFDLSKEQEILKRSMTKTSYYAMALIRAAPDKAAPALQAAFGVKEEPAITDDSPATETSAEGKTAAPKRTFRFKWNPFTKR